MIGVVLGTCWNEQIRLPPDVIALDRRHLYDGYSVEHCILPMGVAANFGCDTVILTNACGGVNDRLDVGEVVCISDHLNLTGVCPPVGFLTLDKVWTTVHGLRSGVFAQVRGPVFETPAEARMLRTMGADMVGMSTVLEAIAAHHHGLKVIGLSLITDVAGSSAGHDDVLKVGRTVNLSEVLEGVLDDLKVAS